MTVTSFVIGRTPTHGAFQTTAQQRISIRLAGPRLA